MRATISLCRWHIINCQTEMTEFCKNMLSIVLSIILLSYTLIFVSDIILDSGNLYLAKQIKKLIQKKIWTIIEWSKSKNKSNDRSSHPEVFLGKGVLKVCNKFTAEHHCHSVNSIKLLCNFIEITLRYGFSPVNLMHIFRTPFSKNIFDGLLLQWRKLRFIWYKYIW